MIDDNAGKSNFVILDVRTPSEFAEGHIENAVSIDVRDDTFRTVADTMDKCRTYMIHCKAGTRSAEAIIIMKELGFKRGYEIIGGFIAWQDEGYPEVKVE